MVCSTRQLTNLHNLSCNSFDSPSTRREFLTIIRSLHWTRLYFDDFQMKVPVANCPFGSKARWNVVRLHFESRSVSVLMEKHRCVYVSWL